MFAWQSTQGTRERPLNKLGIFSYFFIKQLGDFLSFVFETKRAIIMHYAVLYYTVHYH